MLTRLHDSLWVHPVPYRAAGLWLGRQLIVVRLAGGGLWIHSPVPWTPELRRSVGDLGNVELVVGPNCFHDECLREFQSEYPQACLHGAPGLARLRKDIRFDQVLGDLPDPAWREDIDQCLIGGMPRLNEVVFLHRASRSLIIADLAFNLGPDGPWLTALLLKLNGAWGHFGPSRLCRSLMRDRAAVRASLERVLEWDFDRILVGHGRNIATGGRTAFRQAFRFLWAG